MIEEIIRTVFAILCTLLEHSVHSSCWFMYRFCFVVFYPPWYLSTNVVAICFTVCLFVCLSVSLFGKPYLGDGLMDSHQISAEHRHWAETSLLPFWSRSTRGPGVGDLNNVFYYGSYGRKSCFAVNTLTLSRPW